MARNAAEKRIVEKADPEFVRGVLDSIFENSTEPRARQHYEEFLAESIEMLARHHPGRWGVTVFQDLIRLNSGKVECLVLHSRGLRVLLNESIAPAGVRVESTMYRWAPGCQVAALELSEIVAQLPSLAEAHQSGILIAAAKQTLSPQIRQGHSTGVTSYLRRLLDRPLLPDPDYVSPSGSVPSYSEGDKISLWLDRYERDPKVRQACLAHYGTRCAVCSMSFLERYGDTMDGFVHVHHLNPLSWADGPRGVDPIADLRPVCPNCHAVIHQSIPPLSIEQAQTLIQLIWESPPVSRPPKACRAGRK